MSISITDSKGTGIVPSGLRIFDNDATLEGYAASTEKNLDFGGQFDDWRQRLIAKPAKAIEGEDYIAQAARLDVAEIWISVVFAVESRNGGFNADGTPKILLERHKVHSTAKAAGFDLKALTAQLGADLIHTRPGGYKGGIAEWWRLREVVIAFAEQCGDFARALELALQCISMGRPQIMGFNHKLAGYDSAREMMEDFACDEDNHLEAFCTFNERTGLVSHLRAASTASNPYRHVKQYALGYNGDGCCPLTGKNYAREMMTEWRTRGGETDTPKGLGASRTIWGNIGGLLGLGGIGTTAASLAEDPAKLLDAIKQLKALAGEADSLRGQVAEFAQQSAVLTEQLQHYETWLGVLVIALVISGIGNAVSLWARFDDWRQGRR